MIDAIIALYNEELDYYSKINEIINEIENKDYDILVYNSAFKDVSDILTKIEDINKRVNIIKDNYIKENNIKEFSKECIIKAEGDEKYTILKETVENLVNAAASAKKKQDKIIIRIQKNYHWCKNAKSNIEGIKIYNKNMNNMK